MITDFSIIDFKDRPILMLKNLDGAILGILGNAFNIKLKAKHNEVSELSFELPEHANEMKQPFYNETVGMRIIDFIGIGQFILNKPKITNDGVKEIKYCTALSLEYEFTYKTLTIENSTYNFWNPFSPNETILDIILDKMPSWSIGEIDTSLIGKYRTFDVNDENLYNFIKSTLQESYQCIFDFDTYNRKINVKSVSSFVPTSPIYLSLNNLLKEIEIEEDTDNLFTCFSVSGAEGVDIRSVNPMGTDKIYNIDYFLNTTNFTQSFTNKWNTWKTTHESYKTQYYNLVIEKSLQISKKVTEEAKKTDMDGELQSLYNLRSTYLQDIAENDPNLNKQEDLDNVNVQISNKENEIETQKNYITQIQNDIDTITTQIVQINKDTAFRICEIIT